MKPVEIAKGLAMFLAFYIVTVKVVKPLVGKVTPAGKDGKPMVDLFN